LSPFRLAVAVLVLALAGMSCTPEDPPEVGPATVEPTEPATLLEPVVIEVNLLEPASGWTRVTSIPFGESDSELGIIRANPAHEQDLAGIPTSFAIAADGSLWILDAVKERVAHYSGEGTYLGSLGHFPFESRWEMSDITMTGDIQDVLLLHSWTAASRVVRLGGPSDMAQTTELTLGGEPASVSRLVAGPAEVITQVEGYAESDTREPGTGPEGWGRALPDGSLDLSDSILLGDGTSMGVEGSHTDGIAVRFTIERNGSTSILPVEFHLVARTGGRTIAGGYVFKVTAATDHALVCELLAASSHRAQAARFGGGRWIVTVDADGAVSELMRLPASSLPDEFQIRRETIDRTGTIYAMVATARGMTILRRT
jgi:hypothetical protein